jgi:hypothetical protein
LPEKKKGYTIVIAAIALGGYAMQLIGSGVGNFRKNIELCWPNKEAITLMCVAQLWSQITFPTSSYGVSCHSKSLRDQYKKEVEDAVVQATTFDDLCERLTNIRI